MMEPLQGEGGIKPATKEFINAIRRICDQTGALMIVDEVQVRRLLISRYISLKGLIYTLCIDGYGKAGKLWSYQNFEVEPDVITSAKALGGGGK